MNFREYEVWHDECKLNTYHHGILLIPVDKKQDILELLKAIRDEHNIPYSQNVKFSKCLKKEKTSRIIKNHLLLVSHILKSKIKSPTKLFNITGKSLHKRNYEPFITICDSFDCKFGFLSTEDYLKTLNGSYSRRVELTFKFILKACCHSMFSASNPIILTKLNFDGHDHLGSEFDHNYLSSISLRNYCKIKYPIDIDDRHISERKDDSLLLMNLIDNAVSAFTSCLVSTDDPYCILDPCNELINRARKNWFFKNPNSEWHKSLSFSKLEVPDGEIKFPLFFENKDQLRLNFY